MHSWKSLTLCILLSFGSTWLLTDGNDVYAENGRHFSVHRDVRMRKEFTAMSYDERKRFIRAYKFVSRHEPFRRRYEYLVGLHRRLFKKVHSEKQFLPWHRWYLLQFENLLRRVDPRVTMPYWDWSIRGQKLWETGKKDLWNSYPWGLGGNGAGMFSCVGNGPFNKRVWRLAPKSGGGCLRRNFIGRMPSVVAIHLTQRLTPKQFDEFDEITRKFYHNELHCCIQGTMELAVASNTPEFLLHHTFIDKLWYDWQKKGPEYKMRLDEKKTSRLRGSHYTVGDFMDSSSLGYSGITVHYQDPFPGYKRLHDTLGSLDHKTLKMLDPYDDKSGNNCCPRTDDEMDKKEKQMDKDRENIPLEVALDYGSWREKEIDGEER